MCRLAWVAGFCIGPFGGNERTWKPFNPILGETFELDLPTNGVRFLAEQVQSPASCVHSCVHKDLQFAAHPPCQLPAKCNSGPCKQFVALLQVSHHPPISAGHAENDKWVYDIVSAPSTKFLGNSVEIYPVGERPPVIHPLASFLPCACQTVCRTHMQRGEAPADEVLQDAPVHWLRDSTS